jgi:hypothetical protein
LKWLSAVHNHTLHGACLHTHSAAGGTKPSHQPTLHSSKVLLQRCSRGASRPLRAAGREEEPWRSRTRCCSVLQAPPGGDRGQQGREGWATQGRGQYDRVAAAQTKLVCHTAAAAEGELTLPVPLEGPWLTLCQCTQTQPLSCRNPKLPWLPTPMPRDAPEQWRMLLGQVQLCRCDLCEAPLDPQRGAVGHTRAKHHTGLRHTRSTQQGQSWQGGLCNKGGGVAQAGRVCWVQCIRAGPLRAAA